MEGPVKNCHSPAKSRMPLLKRPESQISHWIPTVRLFDGYIAWDECYLGLTLVLLKLSQGKVKANMLCSDRYVVFVLEKPELSPIFY